MHIGFEGQQFAILQLLKWQVFHQSSESVGFLLLESVEGADTWRRIGSRRFTSEDKLYRDTEVIKSPEILAEIKHALRRHIVKII